LKRHHFFTLRISVLLHFEFVEVFLKAENSDDVHDEDGDTGGPSSPLGAEADSAPKHQPKTKSKKPKVACR
jgi:hypothetical protein